MAATTGAPRELERWAPLSGVAFTVLMVLGALLTTDLAFLDPGEELAAAYLDDTGKILGGLQAIVLAAFFLIWFGGTLRSVIARAQDDDRLANLAGAGASAAGALILASVAAFGAAALRADEDGEIAAASAATLTDLGNLLVAAVAPVAMAVTVAAVAIAALRSRAILPTWLAWVSAVLALALVILPINFIAILGFGLWTVVVGILLYLRPSPSTARTEAPAT